ncbi:MAG: thiopeptide-type bacteriocin biosynthesis protein [Alcanivoracaceae bacterium]|nr:thiopeptide-type bacteriocin biosynthesis protein [Alcanivoracaceae bacterium]
MSIWEIEQSEFVVLRTPYLPEETMDPIHVESIKNSLRALKIISSRKDIVKAIEFASSSLAEKIHLLNDDLSVDNLKLAASIYKYLTRMSIRSTPFGSFSGVMTLPVAQKTDININPEMRMYIRLDSGCIFAIIRVMENQAIKTKNINLIVRKNSSLYKINDEFRLVVKSLENNHNEFKLDSVKYSDAIEEALSQSENWLSINNLAKKIQKIYPEAQHEQLIDFIYNLLKNQLIESNLTVVVSSNNSLRELVIRAAESKINSKIINVLEKILLNLEKVQSINEKELDSYLLKAKDKISELIPEYDLNKWIHVDSFRDVEKQTYGNEKVKPIIKSVTKLADLFWNQSKAITDFTKQFETRYDDATVPLLEALDSDTGLIFGQKKEGRSPLLKGLFINGSPIESKINRTLYDAYLLDEIIKAISQNKKVVTLDIDKVVELNNSRQKPTIKYNNTASILGTLTEGEDKKMLFNLQAVHGPSALMLLGRFCCGDEYLLKESRKLAKQEQDNNPEAIYAEIIHIPQSIIANISCRPVMRDYEIVYGPGDSSLPSEKQIKCDDLHLKVVRGRLVLFSKKLNIEIRPRLASAHNTSGHNLPVYHFLHALQNVDGLFAGISINKVIRSMPYVPEIRIDNIIVTMQRWIITMDDINTLVKSPSIDQRIACLNKIRQDKNIVRDICYYEGDNYLEFDLDSDFSKVVLINELMKKTTDTKLFESIKGRTDKDIQNNGKTFRHEIIIPCFMKTIDKPVVTSRIDQETLSIRELKAQSSMPGENWKYFKIYTGEASADKLLIEKLAPLANKLIKDKGIESWFYIRYKDPEFHLRLRLKLINKYDPDGIGAEYCQMLKELYQQGIIHRIEEDSYVPEVQRYGGVKILPVCEKLFYLNSVIVSDILNSTYSQKNKDDLMWKFCLRLAWQLALGVLDSLEDLEKYFKRTARYFDNETRVSNFNKKKINENYRKHGLATIIMKSCINTIRHNNHNKESVTIIVSAQSYLTGFYQGLGFKSTGKFYLEDDIPHEQMQIVVV